jgi:hypothetical protein
MSNREKTMLLGVQNNGIILEVSTKHTHFEGVDESVVRKAVYRALIECIEELEENLRTRRKKEAGGT